MLSRTLNGKRMSVKIDKFLHRVEIRWTGLWWIQFCISLMNGVIPWRSTHLVLLWSLVKSVVRSILQRVNSEIHSLRLEPTYETKHMPNAREQRSQKESLGWFDSKSGTHSCTEMNFEFVKSSEKIFLLTDTKRILFLRTIELSSFSIESSEAGVNNQFTMSNLWFCQLSDISQISLVFNLFGTSRMFDSIQHFTTFQILNSFQSKDIRIPIDTNNRESSLQ